MSDKVLNFPAGSVITMTTGEYSDFQISAYVVTLKHVDLPALVREFKATHQPEHDHDKPSADRFPSWLIANGYCMPVETTEVQLGDGWGGFDPELEQGEKP